MGIDILLLNVRTPRYRSLSDTIIENGLSILKEHMRQRGLNAVIEDKGKIDDYKAFAPEAITAPLHWMSGKILDRVANGKKPPLALGIASLGLQKLLDAYQKRKMEAYLESLADYVKSENIPVVGKKVWYGLSFYWAQQFTEILKRKVPEVIVVDGGFHPSVYQEYYVEQTKADLVVLSEGEEALTQIVRIAKERRSKGHNKKSILEAVKAEGIPNVAYRNVDKVIRNPIQHIPLDRKTVQRHEDDFEGRLKIAVITDALGCPHSKCNFCDYHNIYNTYMVKSPALVADEIQYFLEKGVGLFRFTSGSNSLEDSRAIAEEIIKRGFTIHYSIFNRCEKESKKRFDDIVKTYITMIKSGLRAVFVGAESGNDEVLKTVINKGSTREDILHTVKAIRKASQETGQHVDICMSIIYPHPVLNGISLEQSYNDTLSLIKETMPESVLPNLPAPFTGSTWFNDEQFGFDYYDSRQPDTAHLSRERKKWMIANEMMAMEYLLYLPPRLWKLPNITINGMNTIKAVELNGRLRTDIRSLGIETDIGDEHFLMLRASGFNGKEGIKEFKHKSMQSILSCNYRFAKHFYENVNNYSSSLGNRNIMRGNQ